MRDCNQVIKDILHERERQNLLWGSRQDHSLPVWMLILGEEVGEACKAVMDCVTREEIRTELVHVAAVAMQMIEYIDRKTEKER